jgi:hypothetical protein
MDLKESASDRAFREEVRAFIAQNLPQDLKDKSEAGLRMHVHDGQRWHKILAAHGWGAPGWPKEIGGCGWDHGRQYIWEEEMAMAGCPPLSPFAVKMVGPVIAAYGTPEQKARFLPPAASGEHLWCQGYSEPNAGSDLATLRTMAVRDGDNYIVNGMKIWNSYGHEADWMFAGRKVAGGHLGPPHRYEDEGDIAPPDHHHRRVAHLERDSFRQRRGAGRQSYRRGEQGLDLREVPVGQRAGANRADCAVDKACEAHQGDRRARIVERSRDHR